jgi:hypothetical protein
VSTRPDNRQQPAGFVQFSDSRGILAATLDTVLSTADLAKRGSTPMTDEHLESSLSLLGEGDA